MDITAFDRQWRAFQQCLSGIPLERDQRWYVAVLFNRLMCTYFMQAQGWLNHQPDYLRERLAWSRAHLGVDRYYRDFLCLLFFQGFAQEPAQRPPAVTQMVGLVPFLHAGLFLPHPLEERYGATISLPDHAFDGLFAFFDLWHWSLHERSGCSAHELDPELLGAMLERYINQKQMGAYYTRADITGYICRSSIIPALFDKADLSLQPLDLPRTIVDYIYPAMRQKTPLPTETERELLARQTHVATLIAAAQRGAFDTINTAVTANLNLEKMIADLIPQLDAPTTYRLYTVLLGDPQTNQVALTILDPTVGSGAFLFAALRVLEPIYAALLARIGALLATGQAGDLPLQHVLDAVAAYAQPDLFIITSIVTRNLYGVDLMPEAVEICKLRLCLRILAAVDTIPHAVPLPDMDFNIWVGNTLVGYIDPEAQTVPAHWHVLQQALRSYRQSQDQRARRTLRTELDAVCSELHTALVQQGQIHPQADGSYNTQPFHWCIAFEAILNTGGFDVIVGNPPYLVYSKVRNVYQIFGYQTEATGNLYAFTIERALQMLADHGRLGMIVPIASVSTAAMLPLQQLYTSYHQYHSHYAVRPGKLFAGVDMNLTITLLYRDQQPSCVFSTTYYRWFSGRESDRPWLFEKLTYTKHEPIPNHANLLPKIGSIIEMDILRRMHSHGYTVKDFTTQHGSLIYYHSGGRYWRKALLHKLSSHYKPVIVPDHVRPIILLLLNSQLFYWYWIINSNCMDVVSREVLALPIFDVTRADVATFSEMEAQLLAIYQQHQTFRSRRGAIISTDEIHVDVRQAKTVLDAIDRLLAIYYGFTDQELDFILNYDLKYRMNMA